MSLTPRGDDTFFGIVDDVPTGWEMQVDLDGAWKIKEPAPTGNKRIVRCRERVAPTTKTINWFEASGRTLPDGRRIVGVSHRYQENPKLIPETGLDVIVTTPGWTVEVLV